MLGGLEAYGSDDSDVESSQTRPDPTSTSKIPNSSLSHPTKAPRKPKVKRPVFTVPSKPSLTDDDSDVQRRPAKKAKLDSRAGAGSSSLLAMLPAPSKRPPVRTAPTRVLGSASQGAGTGVMMHFSTEVVSTGDENNNFIGIAEGTEEKSITLLPPSLAKGKAKLEPANKESKSMVSTPAVDFFSLGASSSRITSAESSSKPVYAKSDTSSSSVTITSAPIIPTFEPPTPTPSDPYPGYYQLPSGEWAAYDPDFYQKHYEKWAASLRLDGASIKGFEGAEGDDTVEIDAQEQLDLARKEREEKKALTMDAKGGPTAPKMNIKAPKIGSRARTRHQLSALLTEAYENREALEEKIAQGRRNRKEAGNKYGF